MTESSDLRLTRMPLNNGGGHMPALGFGTLIPDAAVTNRPSRRVWTDSGSGIWISTSFILRLHFNRETSRTREIKTAMFFTTTE